MNSKMTPCEKLGYKVGDKFKVVDGTGVHYAVGSFITLIHDDGSSCPRFNGVHAIYESGDSFFPLDFVEKVAKLKPAKQALADAIHQNGGWVDCEAIFAAMDGNGDLFGYSGKPQRTVSRGHWYGHTLACWFFSPVVMKNHHQTILSREEYYQAYPKDDADGWIEWKGGAANPVEFGVLVDVKLANGEVLNRVSANSGAEWRHCWGDTNIIAYRLHKPEAKPELCESVMRSIQDQEEIFSESASIPRINQCRCSVVDIKPTIEQLAYDYRNAKGYADRLQKEAGEAATKAEEFAVEIRKKLLELQELIG